MEITFLGHGLCDSENTVGTILLKSFADVTYDKFSCLVAFASLSGVEGLSEIIKQSKEHIKEFNLFIGIDLKGTSKEALEALLKLDIETKIFYTFSRVLFHPKIYFFEGERKCRIIVGSSNLTKQGLFQSIEASLMIDCDNPLDFSGLCPIDQIKQYFISFFKDENKNIQTLTSELINNLVEGGIVPDEIERAKIFRTNTKSETLKDELIDKLKKLFPSVEIPKSPEGFTIKPPQKQEAMIKKPQPSQVREEMGRLVWRKPNLPQSDVLYEPSGTHGTGCLRLTQAKWRVNNIPINKTTYFRDVLFGNFEWRVARERPFVEATTVLFDITILGNNIGRHRLTIRHKPSGEAGQANYTTSLHWGEISDRIRQTDIRGKNLSLYAPPEGQIEPFFIKIENQGLRPLSDYY